MGTEYRALRYMTRFKCVGSDCQDTCCASWQVLVDKASFKRIKKAFSGSPVDRRTFNKAIERNSSATGKSHYAEIRMREDGYCQFLDPKSRRSLGGECRAPGVPSLAAALPNCSGIRGILS